MLGISFTRRIFLYSCPVDMRKNFDGLSAIVTGNMRKDPLRDGAFVFVNRRKTKMKILLWDRHGFWLLYKRLEAGCFQVPKDESRRMILPEALNLTYEQLVMIIEGIDLNSVRRRKRYQLAQNNT